MKKKKDDITPTPETIAEVFDEFEKKLAMLQSYYRVKAETRDKAVMEMMQAIKTIKNLYLFNWHTVEALIRIDRNYKEMLETFGFNQSLIDEKVYTDPEVIHHMAEASKYDKQ